MNASRQTHTHLNGSTAGLGLGLRSFPAQLADACAEVCTLLILVFVATTPSLGKDDNSRPRQQNGPASTEVGATTSLEREAVYRERLARDPHDLTALRVLAVLRTQRGDFAEAVQLYRRLLQQDPDDRENRVELARALDFHGDFQEAIGLCEEILKSSPSDTDALEEMARAYVRSDRPSLALPILEALAKKYPANPDFQIDLASAEVRAGDYAAARASLAKALSTDPNNHDARVQLAYIAAFQGYYRDALQRFNELLKENPADPDALLGNARVAYYRGDLKYAQQLVSKLAADQPNDVDTTLLQAGVERALHNRQRAQELLAHAQQLSQGNSEARELAQDIRNESRITLHTSVSFAREISTRNADADPADIGSVDLRSFGYETTLGFSALPRSDSYLSLYYLPSNSPAGGLRGAVAPAQFLYRQTTYLAPHLTLRGGAGLVRFGPGDLVGVPTQTEPIRSADTRPLGYVNLTYAPWKRASLDLTAARSAINYTPTAVRLGVMENRVSGGLNYFFNRRTELHLETFYAEASSVRYEHVTLVNGKTQARTTKADHDQGLGASINFNRHVIRTHSFGLDFGYSGLAFGYTGRRYSTYMGFFNPRLYQRHYLTTSVSGKIRGPVGYDFSGGIGIQQVEQGTALTRAMILNPAITLNTSPRMTLTLGYTYYESAQYLGPLHGNAVRVSTDWRF
jgi:tetratricopeptide (TPR) repeat protein